jgi:predicted acyltransferase
VGAGLAALSAGPLSSGAFAALEGLVMARPPENRLWAIAAYQTDHAAWDGCSFWDLIQPSFMFMVGVAMPFSYASRRAKGQSTARISAHVVTRALILVALGIFLMSSSRIVYLGRPATNFNWVNVLTQIGLGYGFVYLLLGRGLKVQFLALLGILVGYWLLFALYPVPEGDFGSWPFTGFFAHWNKDTNAAAAFDRWFLGLFPYSDSYPTNAGGYQTLNFVPSMATMIFGLMAGELLRRPIRPVNKFLWLVLAGVACLGVGAVLGETVCPIVKRIWTPSWAVFSAGWTFLMLAGFYGIVDLAGFRRWTLPLVVVGMNSIAMYCMSMLLRPWITSSFRTHLGLPVFSLTGTEIFGGIYGPIWQMATILVVLWLVCAWMYRRGIFLRI